MRRLLIVGFALVLCVTAGMAQDFKKFEISPYIGGTLSEGVDVDPYRIPGTTITVDRVSPKSSLSWGTGFDYFATENFSVGFNFGQQFSKLRIHQQGAGDLDAADLSVYNYHGILTYNFGETDAKLRPFFFGGLGATQYSSGQFSVAGITSTNKLSETQFSTTWGGGVKFQASKSLGFKVAGRWTPTYIKSDPAGVWCDPYWWGACWVIGDSQYSNQFEVSAGIVIRF